MVRYQSKVVDTMVKEMGKVERAYFAQCVTLAKLCRLLQEDVGDRELNKDQIDHLEDAFRAAKAAVVYVNNSKFDSEIARQNFINAEGKLTNLDLGKKSEWKDDVQYQMMQAQRRDSVAVQRLAQDTEQAPREEVEVSVKICDITLDQASETKRLRASPDDCVGELLFLLAPPGQKRNTPTRLTFHPHFYFQSSQSPPTYHLLQPWETLESLPNPKSLVLVHNKSGSPFLLLTQETIHQDGSKKTDIVITALDSELPAHSPLCRLEDQKTGKHLSTSEKRWDEISTEVVHKIHQLEWKLVIDRRGALVIPESLNIELDENASDEDAFNSPITNLFGDEVRHGHVHEQEQEKSNDGLHRFIYRIFGWISPTSEAVSSASSVKLIPEHKASKLTTEELEVEPSISHETVDFHSDHNEDILRVLKAKFPAFSDHIRLSIHSITNMNIPGTYPVEHDLTIRSQRYTSIYLAIREQPQSSSWKEHPPEDLTDRITQGRIVGGGGYSDVLQGTLQTDWGDIQVAIKCLRMRGHQGDQEYIERLRKRLYKEMLTWNGLQHRNIVPLLGFSLVPDGLPRLISPWYSNGTVVEYLQLNPNVNRLQILHDVIQGLNYLHLLQLVHGDIKGDNVLVNEEGVASLCDFGLAMFIDDALHKSGFTTTNHGDAGTVRFLCPELLEGQRKTTMTDIWAFGCFVIEVMTGQTPYSNFRNNFAVQMAIVRGEPPLPIDYDISSTGGTSFWNVFRRCWEFDPRLRPIIAELVGYAHEALRS